MVPEAAGSNPVSHPAVFSCDYRHLANTRQAAERTFQDRVIGNFPENSELERSIMARPKNPIPSYRKHASGQARVTINGRDYLLGLHGTKASKREYDRLVAEYPG